MRINLTLWCSVFACLAVSSALSQDRELSETSTKLAQQISQSGKRTIAVVGITNAQNYGPQFSDYVADQLSTFLAGAGKGFDVVTRSRLTQIMDERRLKFGASFDAAAFQQLGKLAGADAIIGGNYRVLGSVVSLNLQILDVSRGTIIAGTICSIPRTKDVEELLGTSAVTSSSDLPKNVSKETRKASQEVLLPSPDSFHMTETVDTGYDTIGVYKCKKNSETIICFLVVTRHAYGNVDYNVKNSHFKLVDNFNIEHLLSHSYFVTGRGKQQVILNLGKGDSAWLALEFDSASTDITSARIIFTQIQQQLHAKVE